MLLFHLAKTLKLSIATGLLQESACMGSNVKMRRRSKKSSIAINAVYEVY